MLIALGGKTRATNQNTPSTHILSPVKVEMSSQTTVRPRTYFLKRQLPTTSPATNRIGFLIRPPSSNATKESAALKEYAEKMMREQKVSSQRLSQLVRSYPLLYPVGNLSTADVTYHSLLSSKLRKEANPNQVASHAKNREFTHERACCYKSTPSGANVSSAGCSRYSEEESARPHHLSL